MAKDSLDKLADDIKATTSEYCAKVAEIHRIPQPENEYQCGYNAAVTEIAARIRRIK
jgi:hypothetical protein